MKKLLIITFLFSNFQSFSSDEGSDKIIKKYLKAIGGAKEWEAVKTIKTIRHEERNALYDAISTISILRDKGYRKEFIYSGGTPSVFGFYNNKGWLAVSNFKMTKTPLILESSDILFKMKDSIFIEEKTHDIKKVKRKQIDDIADNNNPYYQYHFFKWQIQMPWNFTDYETKGYKVTYKGDSKISIDDVSELEMISNTGDTTRYFFDKKTSLLLKAIHKNMQLDLSNYKQVNKVKIPYEVTEIMTDYKFPHAKDITPFATTYIIDQVKLNEPMDEKIFMKPKQ